MSGYPISVGQSTHSHADTSARHHIVGRLCTNMYQSLMDPMLVINNKNDYVAVRYELALAIGRSYNEKRGVSPASNCKGPVPVITNVAPFRSQGKNDLMGWYVKLYDSRSIEETKQIVNVPCTVKGNSYFPPELYFGGFVMTHNSQAHPINGDTAVTLFIGGVITVKNGRFPVTGGDEMQWYLEDEADCGCFDDKIHGMRVARDSNAAPSEPDPNVSPLDRESFKMKTHSYGERAFTKAVAMVKSCRPGLDGRGCTVMDKRRVFGIALGDAGPFEKVDIKVSRQSH